MLSPQGWSLWFCEYKYNSDYTKRLQASNLIGGWFQVQANPSLPPSNGSAHLISVSTKSARPQNASAPLPRPSPHFLSHPPPPSRAFPCADISPPPLPCRRIACCGAAVVVAAAAAAAQRLDATGARKLAFGNVHVFGEEPDLELAGCWLIRGEREQRALRRRGETFRRI